VVAAMYQACSTPGAYTVATWKTRTAGNAFDEWLHSQSMNAQGDFNK
jgi:hypothetical protein